MIIMKSRIPKILVNSLKFEIKLDQIKKLTENQEEIL